MNKPFAVEYTVSGKRRYFETRDEAESFAAASPSMVSVLGFHEATGLYVMASVAEEAPKGWAEVEGDEQLYTAVIPGNEGRVTQGEKLDMTPFAVGDPVNYIDIDLELEGFSLGGYVTRPITDDEIQMLVLPREKPLHIQMLGRSPRSQMTEQMLKDVVVYGAGYSRNGLRVPPQSVTMDFGRGIDKSVITGMRIDGEKANDVTGLIGRTVMVDIKTGMTSDERVIQRLRDGTFGKLGNINALYGRMGSREQLALYKREYAGLWSDSGPEVFKAFLRAMRHSRAALKAKLAYQGALYSELLQYRGKKCKPAALNKVRKLKRLMRFSKGSK